MNLFPAIPGNVKPLSISGLTTQIKAILETNFASLWVTGEIASFSISGAGHAYFTLKDKTTTLPTVMWRMTAQRYRSTIKDGMEVVVRGRLTVYPPHGKYQFTVDEFYQTGVGVKDAALRALKEKLLKLGYFAPERKRPLPALPRRIALVTSRSGAAIRDMLEIITRRWPCAELWVCGVRVQGIGAPEEIAFTLHRLNQFRGIDVILLGRGGGSSEDLAAFNEEIVADAIFNSRVPVVSAVGHEVDVTIADLVADRRAATPSEAAELATPDRVELLEALNSRQQRLHQLLIGKYHAHKQYLHNLAQRRAFRFPLERLRDQERRIDDWDERLRRTLRTHLRKDRQRLDALAGKLASLSPLNVLARGYSLTRGVPDQTVIRSIEQTAVGDTVEIVLADGRLQAEVKAKIAHEHADRTENL